MSPLPPRARTALHLCAFSATLLGGCMFGPYDGEVVATRSSPVEFWGVYPVEGETMQIDARFPDNGQFYYVADTQTGSSSAELFGTQWFMWSSTEIVPSWAWSAGVSGFRAEVRTHGNAGDLASYPKEGLNCVLVAANEGLSPTTAQAECASPATPSAFVYTADYQGLPSFVPATVLDYPQQFEHDETDEIQGIASTSTHWLFANNSGVMLGNQWGQIITVPHLVRIPLQGDLERDDTWSNAFVMPMPDALLSQGYDHYGDIDVYDGHLYVPVEGPHLPGAIAKFDLDFEFEGYAVLETPTSAWVAIEPATGRLFTSAFTDVSEVRAYAMVSSPAGDLIDLRLAEHRTLRDERGDPLTIQRVQGGAFSERGNLYLVSDADYKGLAPDSGIYGFEGDSLRLETFAPIDYDPGAYEELQGIDVRQLDGGTAPGIDGQLHVVLLDNDWSTDDLYLKHYRIEAADQSPWL